MNAPSQYPLTDADFRLLSHDHESCGDKNDVVLTKEAKMSHNSKSSGSSGLARRLWSSWIRFGSPRISIDSDPLGAKDKGEAIGHLNSPSAQVPSRDSGTNGASAVSEPLPVNETAIAATGLSAQH